jgi:hypothetical protein
MSSIQEAAMLRIRVFWDETQYQLSLIFYRNVAFILKDPCTLDDRALHCLQMSVATYPATLLHILGDLTSHKSALWNLNILTVVMLLVPCEMNSKLQWDSTHTYCNHFSILLENECGKLGSDRL